MRLRNIERLAEVMSLAESGQVREAVDLLCAISGMNLREASLAVEKMLAGESVALTFKSSNQRAAHKPADLTLLEAEIRSLAADENEDEAITRLQQMLAVGTSEARTILKRVLEGENLQEALIATDQEAARYVLHSTEKVKIDDYHSPLEPAPQNPLFRLRRRSFVRPFLYFAASLLVLLPIALYILTMPKPLRRFLEKYNPFSYAHVLVSIEASSNDSGDLEDPRAVALDGQGYVYVADHDDSRIVRFDQNGNFQNKWTVRPAPNEVDLGIKSMAAAPDGRVFVALGSEIIVYDGLMGKELQRFRVTLPGKDQIANPNQLYYNFQKNLGIVTGGENVLVFDEKQQSVLTIENAVSQATKITELDTHLTFDRPGNLYLLGAFNETVVKYTPDGRLLSRFGSKGNEPGQFVSALAIAVAPDGRIFVSDYLGVNIFTPDGHFILRFDLPYSTAFSMAFDTDGDLWAATSDKRVIEVSLPAP